MASGDAKDIRISSWADIDGYLDYTGHYQAGDNRGPRWLRDSLMLMTVSKAAAVIGEAGGNLSAIY